MEGSITRVTAQAQRLAEMGARLTALRVEAKQTQTEVGKTVGVSRRTISNWENGKCEPSNYHLMLFARHFGVSMDYLTTGRNEENFNRGPLALQ